jgi:hypothetical protein
MSVYTAKLSLILLGFLPSATLIGTAGEVCDNLFHNGSGKDKPAWDQKTQKRIESCTTDYQAALRGNKPAVAQPDPSKTSTATDQFYQGDGYQLHVTKTSVDLDGVTGFVYGVIVELEPEFAEGNMHSMLHTTFYTVETMKKTDGSDAPFHLGTGKDKPAWNEKAEKRVQACRADYQAVLEGKKPVHAKPAAKQDAHFYKGEGYNLDIIEESVEIGGVAGFFYGPVLDFEPDISRGGDMDSISHVAFYTADQMKKLLGK